MQEITQSRSRLSPDNAPDTLKLARKMRKAFAQLVAIDFFPAKRVSRSRLPCRNWKWL
jgi:hypothetical protein